MSAFDYLCTLHWFHISKVFGSLLSCYDLLNLKCITHFGCNKCSYHDDKTGFSTLHSYLYTWTYSFKTEQRIVDQKQSNWKRDGWTATEDKGSIERKWRLSDSLASQCFTRSTFHLNVCLICSSRFCLLSVLCGMLCCKPNFKDNKVWN